LFGAALMYVAALRLVDFRGYETAELQFPAGITVISGANAQGKTSLLEAIAWAARGASFRGVPDAALVRVGAETAIVRMDVVDGPRTQLFEAELHAVGRNRVRINHQNVTRRRDQRELLQVSVFAPDDLQLVKSGPALRRDYLDDVLVTVSPRYESVGADYERVLRQRNALLRGGMRGSDAMSTLEVFDAQLSGTGGALVEGRLRLVEQLTPEVQLAYGELAGTAGATITATYGAAWAGGPVTAADSDLEARLLGALEAGRRAEIDRGVTLAGPHRDEWQLLVGGLESRTHASQGEQRTLALALRLAAHRLCGRVAGVSPVLLLDDVFSELDDQRAVALLQRLDAEQTLITTAGALPSGVHAARALVVEAGRIEEAAA
jgi:DNA replication and repair protein RecF